MFLITGALKLLIHFINASLKRGVKKSTDFDLKLKKWLVVKPEFLNTFLKSTSRQVRDVWSWYRFRGLTVPTSHFSRVIIILLLLNLLHLCTETLASDMNYFN